MGVIRKIRNIVVGYNPVDGCEDELAEGGQIHNLSDQDGSLESVYYKKRINQHCGCFAPAAGRCSICGKTSCEKCHQHCGGTENPSPLGCGRPLCREHSHFITLDDGRTLPFCESCSAKIARKRIGRKIANFLLPSSSVKEVNDGR